MHKFVTAFFLTASATALSAAELTTAAAPGAVAPAIPTQPFAVADAEAVIPALATALEANYVIPETGKKYAAAIRARFASGAYRQFATNMDFAKAVTIDLQSVARDGHLKLFTPEMVAQIKSRKQRPDGTAENFIEKSGWLAPGVAYISFTMFSGSDQEIADIRQFLSAHADAKTLILDVRKHRGGGMDEMDVIFAQLFAKPTDLLELDTRAAVDGRDASGSQDYATLFKVAAPAGVVRRLHRAIPAAQPTGLSAAKVFVLTSSHSASAAEHFALALKRTGRATLIGETTRGAGNYGQPFPLPGGYAAFIPFGRTFDPATGEGWEGTGVKPDVAVPADAALDEALKLAGAKTTAQVALATLK